MTAIAHIDFETRSAADLKVVGLHNYANAPGTDVWCLAWAIGDAEPEVWRPGQPPPPALAEHVALGGRVVAHNAPFELAIWNAILAARYGFPALRPEQCECTMAMGYAMGLPGALEDAALALGLRMLKDGDGRALMLRMSRPRSRPGVAPIVWWDEPEKIARLEEYCRQDVRVERELHARLVPLGDYERRVWLADYAINKRGVQLDVATVRGAHATVEKLKVEAGTELARLTGGAVTGVGALAAHHSFSAANGTPVESLAKSELPDLIGGLPDGPVKAALTLRSETGKASLAKLDVMLNIAGPDGRLRNLYQYYGAGTGRWCLTGDHEVLTPSGWTRLEDWGGGDIACWSPDETVSFQKAAPVSFPFAGEMVAHTDSRIDQLATAEHRMPAWDRHGVFATWLAGDPHQRHVIPYTGTRVSRPRGDADALRVLIMVQADGHFPTEGGLKLHFKKARKIERCRALLRRAGILFVERANSDSTVTLSVADRHLPAYLQLFSADKRLGWWLLRCDAELVFSELEHWDAYRSGPNSLQYSSTEKQNVDVLQALAHLSGRAALVTKRARHDANWADCYALSVWLEPSNRHQIRGRPERVAYEGTVYCAKTRTGFFLVRRGGKVWVTGNSGRAVQPHNLTRDVPEAADAVIILKWMAECNSAAVDLVYGPPLTQLSRCLRPLFVARPGHVLVGGDWSNVEGRGVAWFCGEEWKIRAFRDYDAGTGPDLYKLAYSKTFNCPVDSVSKGQRQIGKVEELAFGYAGGRGAFATMGKQFGLVVPDAEAEAFKKGWRAAHPNVVRTWKDLERAALDAVRAPGSAFTAGYTGRHVTFKVVGSFLWCLLPSGRALSYPYPKILDGEYGPQLTYMAKPSPDDIRKGRVIHDVQNGANWARLKTYGGSLLENIVQAFCRDFLADLILWAEARGDCVVVHTHDDCFSEVAVGRAEEARAAWSEKMNTPPAWAAGFPLHADVEMTERYGL